MEQIFTHLPALSAFTASSANSASNVSVPSSTQETACGHFFPPPVLPGFQPTDLHLLQSHVGFSIRFLDGKDAQRIIFLWDNFQKKSHWVQGEKRSSRFVRELNQGIRGRGKA